MNYTRGLSIVLGERLSALAVWDDIDCNVTRVFSIYKFILVFDLRRSKTYYLTAMPPNIKWMPNENDGKESNGYDGKESNPITPLIVDV